MHQLPRDPSDDYTHDAAAARRQVVSAKTGTQLYHIAGFSFDPGILRGNIEGFSGIAQVLHGFAGPLLVHGEHARGGTSCRWQPPRAPWSPATAGGFVGPHELHSALR